MVVMEMAVAVMATREGTLLGGCKGMQSGAGGCKGEVGGVHS